VNSPTPAPSRGAEWCPSRGAPAAVPPVSNPYIRDYPSTNPPGYGRSCQNIQSRGVYGQYGAWGWYIDGCRTATIGLLGDAINLCRLNMWYQ
jgi:hypothetical protein